MLFLLGHSSRNKKTHLIPIKPMTLLCFIGKTSFFCSFILSSRLVYLPLLCPYLTSSPVLYSLSHFGLLSLSSCHRGKQNTVAMETAHREERGEAAYETSSVETEAYIWPFPVCGLGGRFNLLWTLCLSFPVWKTTRQTEWQRVRKSRGKGNKEMVRKVYGVCSILIITFGRNCLVIVRPSSFLPVAQHNTHYS